MTRYVALPTALVRAIQSGGSDAYGIPPERCVSTGNGNPCRHCLRFIPDGQEMLILAHRPFRDLHPYAETGPIFLCAEPCERFDERGVPPILKFSPSYLIRGYSKQDRIVYGTGAVVETSELDTQASVIFENPEVEYIHVRSARNNCYQARIDRG